MGALNLPDREGLRALARILGGREGETRLVGGAVRDTLAGQAVKDIDLATRLAPEEVLARLEKARIKAVPTGMAHGTITAVLSSGPVEVTATTAVRSPSRASFLRSEAASASASSM